MTPNKQPINSGTKAITVRWSEDFWEAAAIEATKRRRSLQDIVTDAVSAYLKLDYPSGDRSEPTSPVGGKKKTA